MNNATWKSNIPSINDRIEIGALRGLVGSAIMVHKTAVVNCVVDTGRLKSSISYTVDGGSYMGYSTRVTPTMQNNKPTVSVTDHEISKVRGSAFIGTNVQYAWVIEVNGGKNGRGKGFIRNALATRKTACERVIASEIERAIKYG